MRAQKPTALRRYMYQGDPLLAPAPPELASILERYRGQPDALITVLEEMQDHYGYLPQQGLQYTARALGFHAQAWGSADLPGTPGLTVVEMMHAAVEGKIHAMYIMGENPMLSDPNITQVEAALRALDFLVVQDIFLSETAQRAHVVLPAASALEKDGAFTNTERRVQRLAAPLLVDADSPGAGASRQHRQGE